MSRIAFLLLFTTPLIQSFLTPRNRCKNKQSEYGRARHEERTALVVPLLASTPPPKPLFSLFPPMDDNGIRIGGRDITSHVTLLHDSLQKLTGRGICERMGISEDVLQSSNDTYNDICLDDRFVLISHGTEEDPIYNFANLAGLEAFVRTWEELIKIPSRQSVVFQTVDEELRIELIKSVTNDGYVEGASGTRVRGDDKFIRLVDAVVWNLYDSNGVYSGQAALFDREKCPILSSIDEK